MHKLTKMIGGRRRWALAAVLTGTIGVSGFLVGGAAPANERASVVYVVSRSGSMGTPTGVCGTRLACVKAAITAVNSGLQGDSTVGATGLAISNTAGAARDVDFGQAGAQLLVRPDRDGNHNGRADLADAAHRLSLGGATCYACGLSAAAAITDSATEPSSRNVVVFIADRPNQIGPGVASLAGTFDSNTEIRAIALGPRTTCGPQQLKVGRGGRTEVAVGSLAPVATLTAAGSCVRTSDYGNLANVIEAAIG